MVPYLLTGLSVLVAGVIHWSAPHAFWRATLTSTATILLLSVAALFIFQASGFLVSEETGEEADIMGSLLVVTALVSFFGFLISIFVGWFFISRLFFSSQTWIRCLRTELSYLNKNDHPYILGPSKKNLNNYYSLGDLTT